MKIQQTNIVHAGVSYPKTYVIIPKWIRRESAIQGKEPIWITVLSPRTIRISKTKHLVDDVQVTLSECWTRQYKGKRYTVLRLVIPVSVQKLAQIETCTKAEFIMNPEVIVRFKKK